MIQIENITRSFKKKCVLKQISTTIQPGYIYGLLGKNGEGKTTLLKLISGLLFPDSGACLVNGQESRKRTLSFLRSFYFLPEEPFLPAVKVKTYIQMYAPFYNTFDPELCNRTLQAFGISPEDELKSLSLGQRKKAAIALAFGVNTPILLLDEPTNGLDIPSKSVFRQLLASLMQEERTVIISTHQVRDLESLIDAVLILDKQQIILNATLADITRKLSFRKISPQETPLYSQSSLAGTIGITENTTGEETPVDLELLFNAIICRQTPIASILKNRQQ